MSEMQLRCDVCGVDLTDDPSAVFYTHGFPVKVSARCTKHDLTPGELDPVPALVVKERAQDREIAEAIRYAGEAIAKAILVSFLEPDERQEAEQQNEEQAEIERIRKLQRGE